MSGQRAPATEATGTSGQSFVKGEFEELGWGAVPNPEHDLGTDLWLMARDANRFDLGALVGAQVKTGDSYFKSVETDEESGDVVGWWYAEADDSHFDYWSEHTTPHILVLRDVKTKTSYWVHVTSEVIQSTGKGNKVLVPASQTVDDGCRDALTSVATSPSKAVSLDGSAWGTSRKVPQSDRLRYALMAPRLVAPHPNKGEAVPDAIEAMAMLMLGRFSDLADIASPEMRKEADKVVDPGSHVWELFDAAWSWAVSGDLSKLDAVSHPTDKHYLAAVVAVKAAALIEYGRPEDALTVVQKGQPREELGTVDAAWLKSHEARCLVELGMLEEARNLALEVQTLRALAPGDPTATALVAVTTMLVFDMSGFGTRDIGELIQSIDTSTRWWRSQTIASGLQKHFDQQFNGWGRDSSVTWAAADTVWTNLRSATLLAGLSADHSGWRHTMSLLARRGLMKATATDTDLILESLTDLIRAGAKKELVLATRKLGADGPAEPLVTLVARTNLKTTPRSSLGSALAFLRYAGDFADAASADRHADWLIASLDSPEKLYERLKPQFSVVTTLLDSLRGFVRSISPTMKRRVMDHVLHLGPVEDQSLASGYGRLVSAMGDDEWSEADRSLLSARTGDNWELQDDIDAVLAANDPDFRIGLQDKIRLGDLTALMNFGKVTELPEDVAGAAIHCVVGRIESQIEQARSGTYGFGGPDDGHALVILNTWHPNVASWGVVESLLAEKKSHPAHILGTLQALGKVAEHLPDGEKERLKSTLREITQRPAYERDTAMIPLDSSPQSFAALALLRISPEDATDSAMRDLLVGSPTDREVAVNIAGGRRGEGDQNLLISLARDTDVQVRASATVELAKWASSAEEDADLSARVQALIGAGGPLMAQRVAGSLLDMPLNPAKDALLQSLSDHPSALVRARVGVGLTDQSG
jgi:hypothetical protein